MEENNIKEKPKKNNNKIAIIVLLVLAILLIIIGIVFGNKPKEKKETKLELDRNYQTVETVQENTITDKKPVEEDFKDTTAKIGFENIECKENECHGNKSGYKGSEVKDEINFSLMPNGTKAFRTSIYFSKEDNNIDNIYNTLNSIVKNYSGYLLTKEQMNEVYTSKKDEKNLTYKIFSYGEYTLDFTIQHDSKTGACNVVYYLLSTETYNNMQNMSKK